MKLNWIAAALLGLLAIPALAEDTAPSGAFKDKVEQQSYAIGAQTARTLKKDHVEINLDMIIRGFKDGFGGEKLLLSEKELQAVMTRVTSEAHNAMVANRRQLGIRNQADATKYLAENKQKEGVKTTESGLQYKVLKEGAGAKPNLGDTVSVKYRGTLLDGTEFDASPEGKSSQMVVVQTVPGFREALKMMPVGSHWQIVVPGNLAYGERGIGTQIGPYQTLLFDIELLSIDKLGPKPKEDAAKK